jgi:hypothetical protein
MPAAPNPHKTNNPKITTSTHTIGLVRRASGAPVEATGGCAWAAPEGAPHFAQNAPVMVEPQEEQKATVDYHPRTNVLHVAARRNGAPQVLPKRRPATENGGKRCRMPGDTPSGGRHDTLFAQERIP